MSASAGGAGSSVSPQLRVEKSTAFWDEDRDFVLCTIEHKDNCIVHTMHGVLRSILSRSSQFFHDTFNGPQTAFIIGSRTYEGLPVMEMVDDAEDVEHYLRMIYFPWYLSYLRRIQRDVRHGLLRVPPVYYRLLRLAQKFMSYEYIPEIVDAFYLVWPIYYLDWQDKEVARWKKVYESAPPAVLNGQGIGIRWNQTDLLPDPMSTYAFALKHASLYDILPAVAYDIAHSYTTSVRSNDGGFRRLDFSLLDEQYVLNLRAGREALRWDCRQKLDFNLFTGISLRPQHCLHTQGASFAGDLACFDGLRKFWLRYVTPVVSLSCPVDFLDFPTTHACFVDSHGVCDSCVAAMARHLENAKYILWIKLPIYFRLVEWVSREWGFGPDAAKRIEALPSSWRDEVQSVLTVAKNPAGEYSMYEQLRRGPV